MPSPAAKSPKAKREPRFNPMWWFVIGAFVLLITAWSTLIVISQTHKVEVIEPAAQTEAESTLSKVEEGPEG